MSHKGHIDMGTRPDGSRIDADRYDWAGLKWPLYPRLLRSPRASMHWLGSLITLKTDGTGLVYMRNRYYDPLSGQFTQADPIGLAGGLNLYGYAAGDPVNFSDPFGLWPIPASSCLGREGADLGVGLVPVVGNLNDAHTALRGRNIVTGEEVGVGDRLFAAAGVVLPLSGASLKTAGKLVRDFLDNPGGWRRVGAFVEAAKNRRARGGASIQEIFENADGDRMIQHTVIDRAGRAVDGPHPRPIFKPRDGDLNQ